MFIVHGQSCISVTARPTKGRAADDNRGLAAVARITVTAITLIMAFELNHLVIESDDQQGGNPLSDEVPPLALADDLHRQ